MRRDIGIGDRFGLSEQAGIVWRLGEFDTNGYEYGT